MAKLLMEVETDAPATRQRARTGARVRPEETGSLVCPSCSDSLCFDMDSQTAVCCGAVWSFRPVLLEIVRNEVGRRGNRL